MTDAKIHTHTEQPKKLYFFSFTEIETFWTEWKAQVFKINLLLMHFWISFDDGNDNNKVNI